jgi:hypothetical protein
MLALPAMATDSCPFAIRHVLYDAALVIDLEPGRAAIVSEGARQQNMKSSRNRTISASPRGVMIAVALCLMVGASPASGGTPLDIPGDAKASERSFLRTDQSWTIELPIWIPGFRGSFAYGDISLEGEDGQNPPPVNPIEPDPDDPRGDILSRLFSSTAFLKFFFMGRGVYQKDRFIAQVDAFTGHAGKSVKFRYNNRELVSAGFHSTLARLSAGYALYQWTPQSGRARLVLYPYAGGRIHFLSAESDLDNRDRRLDLNHAWGEVLLGLEARFSLRRWLFIVRGDWGNSFSKNSNSYMLHALAYWRLSGLMSLKVGWADWHLDVERTVRDETMTLDSHFSGPSVGLGFHF